MYKKALPIFSIVAIAATFGGLMALTGCGGGTNPDSARNERDPKPAETKTEVATGGAPTKAKAPKAGGGEAYDAAKAVGSIKGVVTFDGKAAKMTTIPVSEAQCAAHHGNNGLKKEDLVVSDDGKVANVFVFVTKGHEGFNFDGYGAGIAHAHINQLGCQYLPHSFGMVADQLLDIESSDPVAHNIHIVTKNNTEQNIAQGTKGISPTHPKFETPELGIVVKCDVHGWMKANVCVFDHPFFAVTAADGSYEIKVPPGKYTVSTWHEMLPSRKIVASADKEVTVTAAAPGEASFTYKSK